MRLIIGGPAYRMELDARHCASLIPFVLRAQSKYVLIEAAHYQHGTPVEFARNSMFEQALAESRASHLLWLDSDNSIPRTEVDPILEALGKVSPLLLIPSMQREGGVSNIWESVEHKLTHLPLDGQVRPCFAGGFGCVGFDLRWYRKHWTDAPWFRSSWSAELLREGQPRALGYTGEDYWHCRELVRRGEQPRYLGSYVNHHARGGA